MLKAHGDVEREGGLVLTARSYKDFDEERPAVASILQAMFALSREVLFVGYSLGDDNIKALMNVAVEHHQRHGALSPRLGPFSAP